MSGFRYTLFCIKAICTQLILCFVFVPHFSYRQVLPVSFVHQELAFDAEKDCLEFLRLLNIIIIEEEELKIDCKASSAAMASS